MAEAPWGPGEVGPGALGPHHLALTPCSPPWAARPAGPLKPSRRPLDSQFPFPVTSGVHQSSLQTRLCNCLESHLRVIAAPCPPV